MRLYTILNAIGQRQKTNDTAIQANALAIAANATAIQTNARNITANQNDISGLDSRLTLIAMTSGELDTLEEELGLV